jgi:hypothetical protein
MVAIAAPGCGSPMEGEDTMPGEMATDEGSAAESGLMTKEELIEFIENNQHLVTVDITVEDLEGVDVDGLIARYHFTKEVIGHRYLRTAVDGYLNYLESKRRAVFMAQEIVSVDSTDEEYGAFREKFISSVSNKVKYIGKVGYLDQYWLYYTRPDGEESSSDMFIGQTKYLEEYSTGKYCYGKNPDEFRFFVIHIPWDSDGMVFEQGISYNKDRKYFLALNPYDDALDMIKTFGGME